MKQILRTAPLAALVLAGITLSAQAGTVPDNVGDVTLYGNITANSPMWQWTVNDYTGPRLDAKPSKATTAGGKTKYPLDGKWFIAASGYLPSFVPGSIGHTNSSVGVTDVTTLTSPDGPVQLNVTGSTATVSIPANGTDAGGGKIYGSLEMSSEELRSYVYKHTGATGSSAIAAIANDAKPHAATPGGSCWVGTAGVSTTSTTVQMGDKTFPTFRATGSRQESGAISALNTALAAGDRTGVIRYADVLVKTNAQTMANSQGPCGAATTDSGGTAGQPNTASGNNDVAHYGTAAHVLALKPTSLSFPTPASGAWNATLTVTAYQM